MFRTSIILLLLAGAAAAADDETRFKPKAYTGKTLQDRPYQPAAYTPAAKPPSTGTPLKPSSGGFWNIFKAKGDEAGKHLAENTQAKDTPFVQREHISVPTMSADPSAVPEKKPFDDAGKRVTDDGYKAPDKPTEKNPLLKPRQSIKETE